MKIEELIDTSKRMVVEYYNRYVQNVEPDMSDTTITTNDVEVVNICEDNDNKIYVTLKNNEDAWLLYNITYDQNTDTITESYISLK